MKIKLREQVKELIARKNWTYEDFGFKIGCDSSYAGKLLNGEKEVSAKKREMIMKVLPEHEFDELFVIENNNGNNH